jgi:hypothetical protein
MQILSYDWFFDREKDRPCLVAGTAPTVVNFPYDKFQGVYLTCNDGPIRMKKFFQADYWINATTIFPIPEKHLDIINSFSQTVFIFADSVTYSVRQPIDLDFLRDNLTIDWFAYDQRHFEHKPCKTNLLCCRLLDLYPGRDTLQEVIQKRYHVDHHYSSASTVAIHILAFAMLLGCNPIYLQGIEIPIYEHEYIHYGKGIDFIARNDEKRKNTKGQKTVFFKDVAQILEDFKYLITVACENGIEVYNLSKTSTLNQVSSLKYKDPGEV